MVVGLIGLIKTVCQLAQAVTATEEFAFQQPPEYRQRKCILHHAELKRQNHRLRYHDIIMHHHHELILAWRPLAVLNVEHHNKKDSGKLAIHPDHPRRRIKVKVCMPGGLRCVVLHIKFY